MPLVVQATSAAATALAHDPDNAAGLVCLAFQAMVIDRDVAAAADYYRRGLEAGADRSLWAFQKAYVLDGPLGRYDDAIAALKDAETRDPLAPNVKQALLEMYLGAGRVADAMATVEAVQKLPSIGPEITTLCGLACIASGDVQRGRQIYEDAKGHMGDDATGHLWVYQLFALAIAQATLGDDLDFVRKMLHRLLEAGRAARAPTAYIIGEAYKALGDYDQAFAWWTRSVERYETWAVTVLPVRNRNHPVIGKDPRFLALLQRMGLPESVPASPGR